MPDKFGDGAPRQEQGDEKKQRRYQWEQDELRMALESMTATLLVVKDGKVGELGLPMDGDWDNPQNVLIKYGDGSSERVTIAQALEIFNATDNDELDRLEEERYAKMEHDPKDPNVVNNGYCWQRKGDTVVEFGKCSNCGKFWGASIKDVTCTCGSHVSLT